MSCCYENGSQFRSGKLRSGLACECRENCLKDLEDVPCSSSLVAHLVFKKKKPTYAFLSLLMCDQNSTMLHFCQRLFNSNASISSIFIIDLITKLLNIKFMTIFFERERLPSTILLPSILIPFSERNIKYLGYRLDLIITCTTAKNLCKCSELKRAVCTLAWMI